MIRLDCEQGSEEWTKARLGIPTASQFHRIITPKTGKLSSSADKYMHELIAERMLGLPSDEAVSAWMDRGNELEPQAVAYYELQREIEPEKVGFCLTDDGRVGCSPDRLVLDDGGLEIKCPSPQVHVAYLLNPDDHRYRCQIQGALLVTGREWWDFLSYLPGIPTVLHRYERDEPFLDKIATALHEFCDRLDEAHKRIMEDT